MYHIWLILIDIYKFWIHMKTILQFNHFYVCTHWIFLYLRNLKISHYILRKTTCTHYILLKGNSHGGDRLLWICYNKHYERFWSKYMSAAIIISTYVSRKIFYSIICTISGCIKRLPYNLLPPWFKFTLTQVTWWHMYFNHHPTLPQVIFISTNTTKCTTGP